MKILFVLAFIIAALLLRIIFFVSFMKRVDSTMAKLEKSIEKDLKIK